MIGLLVLGLIAAAYGDAPYIPRGWTPEGQAFNLPPKQQYGSPNTQYLPSQESARDFNRIETEYGSPNTYSNEQTLRANNQPIYPTEWQQNTNINQFLPSNTNSPSQNNQFASNNQAPLNLNKNNRNQWNINQNPAQSMSTNIFNTPKQISQTQQNNFPAQQQWTPNNAINVQPNYDQSAVNTAPQPSFNQNAQQWNQQKTTQLPNAPNNANQQDVHFDTESNNQFSQFAPRDQMMTQDSNARNVNRNTQQYDGDAPEDVFAIKNDKTTMKPENNTPKMNTENDEAAQLNVAVKTGKSIMSGSMTGQYYLLLPDGRLQRVVYLTSQNDDDSGYTANLMYENVEPLKGPIFSYNDSPLVRVN